MPKLQYYYSKLCHVCGSLFATTNRSHLCCSRACGIRMREVRRYEREDREGAYKVHRKTGCWEWQGRLTPNGYGPYRRYYRWYNGPIPEGLHIDHLCRNRACVNPRHMEPVTQKENSLRGVGAPAQNARKTHCKRGHELTPENTYDQTGQGWRNCLECKRQYFRDYRKRNAKHVRETKRKSLERTREAYLAREHRRYVARQSAMRHAETCVICGVTFETVKGKTCSRRCRGILSTS